MSPLRSVCWLALFPICLSCGGRADDATAPTNLAATNSGGQTNLPGTGSGGHANSTTTSSAAIGGTGGIVIVLPEIIELPMWCGNRSIDPTEQCDDGNRDFGDGCTRLCQVEADFICPNVGQPCIPTTICGDAFVGRSEVCDDGNRTSGDGCSAMCDTVEAGWQCPLPGSACVPSCGDGRRVGDETCDDGSQNGHYVDGTALGCSGGCTLVDSCRLSGAPTACTHYCGDGQIDSDEECDAGTANNDALYGGCTTQCRRGAYCGDGEINGNESCDPGRSTVFAYGVNGCTADCQVAPYCGDGFIDSRFGEECDDPGGLCTHWCTIRLMQL